MSAVKIRDDQWAKIVSYLRKRPDVYVGNEDECRRYMEGVLWIMRSGAQWRLLPENYGKWNSVYKRFSRWCDKSVWQWMHEHFVDDPDLESVMPDSTIVRAHSCSAGAPAKKGGNLHRH